MHLQIRRLEQGELASAADVVAASGLGTSLDDLRLQAALPTAALVGAWLDGRLAGAAGATSYGRVGVIGPMSVLPAEQGRGIGTALLQHVVGWLQRRATAIMMLDATPAGAPLYRRHGFVTDHWTVHLVRREATRGSAIAGDAAVAWAEPGDAEALGAFDADIFGASRRALLARCLATYRGRAVLWRREGDVAAYAIAQERRIGPIVAIDPVAAAAVLGAVLSMPLPTDAVVSLPEPNRAGLALLGSLGFAETRRLERMRLGGDDHPGDITRIYGLMSYALG